MNIVLGIMVLILSFIIMLFAIPAIIVLIRDTIDEIRDDYRYYASRDHHPFYHAIVDNCCNCLGAMGAIAMISFFFLIPLYVGLNTLGVI